MCDKDQIKDIKFSAEVKKEAVKLAAYAIIKELYEEGLILEEELHFIRSKFEIPVE